MSSFFNLVGILYCRKGYTTVLNKMVKTPCSFHDEAVVDAQKQMESAEKQVKPNSSIQKNHDNHWDPYSALIIKPRTMPDNFKVSNDPLISSLFSTRNPRDAGAGLASGIKSVTKGMALGMASLLVCPIVGVSEDGLYGFFKGVGTGVLAAVTLPLTGLGVAGYQVSRGVWNTPKAICKKACGKVWSRQHREWRDNWYSLEEEAAEVLNSPGATIFNRCDGYVSNNDHDSTCSPIHIKSKEREVSNRFVVDEEFYNVLGVSTSASQEEIRRQYYKLAKRFHPDRKSPEASSERFKIIGEAYQVLGDEERREKYDKMGKSACNDMPILDSTLFFMMLFGSDDFEPFIGKLRMALFVELELSNQGVSPTSHDFETCQTAREVKVALELRDHVRPFVCGDIGKWKTDIYNVALGLCKNSFSVAMVETIGWTYQNYANQYLGKMDTFLGIAGRMAKVQEQSRSFGKGFKTLKSILKTAIAERSLRRTKKNGEDEHLLSDQYVTQVCENSLPIILDVMLNICLMDIQGTVRAASKRILKDMSVDLQWRRKRAQALLIMGKCFIDAAAAQKAVFDRQGNASMYDLFIDAARRQQKYDYPTT